MNKKRRSYGLLFALIFLTIIIYSVSKKYLIEKNIDNYKLQTVAKVYKFSSNRSFKHYYYIYFYNEKEYSNYQDLSGFKREQTVGRFYKIDISTKNSSYSRIFLDQEVTDTLLILKAGFDLD